MTETRERHTTLCAGAGLVLLAVCWLTDKWGGAAAAELLMTSSERWICTAGVRFLICLPTCGWRAKLSSDWPAESLTGLWGPMGSDSLLRGRPDGSEWQGDWAGLPPLLLDASSSVSVSIPRLLSLVWVFGRTTSSPPAGNQNVNQTVKRWTWNTEATFSIHTTWRDVCLLPVLLYSNISNCFTHFTMFFA